MIDKIKKIQDSVEDIRKVLIDRGFTEAECADISDLDDLIQRASQNSLYNNSRIVWSVGSKPSKPTATLLDTDTGLVKDLDSKWDYIPTSKTRAIQTDVWMSVAIFDESGHINGEWSEPVKLTGEKGSDGENGKDGIDGAPGKDGTDGKDGKDGKDGTSGRDGKDGSMFEFIYLALPSQLEIEAPKSVNEDKHLPWFDQDTQWTDNPVGISPSLTVEYVSQREKNRDTGVWGPWSKPAIWAQWGKNGRDGNGVEYIFCLTNDIKDVPTVPESNPDQSESAIDGWTVVVDGYTWHDNPQDTSETMRYCWVSIRKQHHQKINDVEVQKWGPYSTPVIWSRFAEDGKWGGRTVQVFSSADIYNLDMPAPVGGSWNPADNSIVPPALPDSFKPDNILYDKTFFTNADEVTYKFLYTSYANFDGDGYITSEWSKPVCITGENGQPGTDGESIQFIFRRLANKKQFDLLLDWHTNSGIKLGNVESPSKIDFSAEYIDGWISTDGGYTVETTDWTDEAEGLDANLYHVEVYCYRTKNPELEVWSEWSMPMYWSIWGEDGQDGAGVEYIYKVTADISKEGWDVGKWDSAQEAGIGHELWLPSRENLKLTPITIDGVKSNFDEVYYQNYQFYFGNSDNWPSSLDFDWTDEPQDVGPNQPVEWVRQRKYTYNPETEKMEWGDFSEPVIWDKWVTDGGAYKTSYAFTRSSAPITDLPQGGGYLNPIPTNIRTFEDGSKLPMWYDYVPGTDEKFAENESIYISKRTFYSKDWTEKDGKEVLVDDIVNGIRKEFDPDWSTPAILSDTNTFQIEWSTDIDCPAIKPLQPYWEEYIKQNSEEKDYTNFEEGWREENPGWSDVGTNAIWMATATFRNGQWSDWSVTKVKGEQGDAGADGVSVNIKGAALYINIPNGETIPTSPNVEENGEQRVYHYLMVKTESGLHQLWTWNDGTYSPVDIETIQNGDGYLTRDEDPMIDGYLWTWDGDSWEKIGHIQGPAGETYHLYIRFSDDGGHTFTFADSETPNLPGTTVGKYIGYCVSEYEVDSAFVSTASNYTWAPWLGEDGWGKEQIFIATNIDIAPPIPKRVPEDNVVDYCPLIPTSAEYSGECSGNEGKWTDRPISPTETFPYVWSVERKASASEFGDWKGDILNPGKAILYNKYVWDTNYVELINDLAVIPMEGSQIDPDFADPIENKILLYEGSNLVEDDENDPNRKITYKVKIGGQEYESTNDDISIDQETGLVKIINLTLLENVDEVTYIAVYRGKAYSKRMKLLKTQHAYEILLNQHVIRRTPYDAAEIKVIDGEEINTSAYPIDKIVSGTIRKWNGTEWFYPDDLEINASYTHISDFDGDDSITSNAETATVDNGHFEFDIADEQGLEKIKIWFKNQDSEEIWEEIGVVANGKDGAKGEDVVTVRLKNPSAYRIRNNGKIENLTISTGIEAKVGAAIKEFTAAVTELPDGFTILNRNPETGEIYYDPSSIIITIPEDIEVGVYNIVFQIVIDDELYTEIFTLTVVQNGENAQYYEIYPNTNIVKNPNSENPEPSTVYPIIWSIDGNSSEQIDGIPAGYSITYTIGDDDERNYNKPIPAENVTSQLIFTLYDKDRKEIDYCEVDPLWDGVDGTGITTRIANPNVKIQVNNKGEFTGFGQTNYLQVFNGTKDITSDCTFVAETNPFFNSINKPTRVVNGENVVVGEFVIDEPTESFEHTPGIYLVDIWITGTEWTGSMVETLTVSIESQGGESPIILDLTNSRVNIDSQENNIVSEETFNNFSVETEITALHGNDKVTFQIDNVQLIYQNNSVIDSQYYSFNNKQFVLNSIPLQQWAVDGNSEDCDIKISGTVIGSNGDQYSKSCILSVHKTQHPFELKINKHVINSNDTGELNVQVYCNNEQVTDFTNLVLKIGNLTPDTLMNETSQIGWKIDVSKINANETVLVKLYHKNKLIDWEDIPIVQNGTIGENACYYTIDSNYSWIVKDSEGEVKVPIEDQIEPKITKIDGKEKTTITNWSEEKISVKYIIDGGLESTYTSSIDPSNVTNQIIFYLYVNGEYYDEFTEVNVVYQEKGDDGDDSITFEWTNSEASTILVTGAEVTVQDPIVHSTLSVYKNTELLTVTNIEVAENGNYLVNPTEWFSWATLNNKLYRLNYEINSDVVKIEESEWTVTLYVTAEDSEGNDYKLYVTQKLAIKKSGGENAFGVDLFNNHTWLVVDNGEITNESVSAGFQIFDGRKTLICKSASLTYNGDQIGSTFKDDGDNYKITISNKNDLKNLGSDIDLILTVTTTDNRSASTVWSLHKSSTKQPYLRLSPNVINSSTTDRTIQIKVYDPYISGEVIYNNGWDGFTTNILSSLDGNYSITENTIVVDENTVGRIGVQLFKDSILLDEEWVPVVRDGVDGIPSWSWRLSDPIEMISYNQSTNQPNVESINSTTTVLASCGGNNAAVEITEVTSGYGSFNEDTFTLSALPSEGNDFVIIIKATGTYGVYSDTAELKYTVKKWFGEPSTVQVHLSNSSTPITTDSNGNYNTAIERTVTITASSGKEEVAITNVSTIKEGVSLDLNESELKITVSPDVTGWSADDVLTVPIVCTLADDYPSQTVTMEFYKVRAAEGAEYPSVYDLIVTPNTIMVGVDQDTGAAIYRETNITPTIVKYSADGSSTPYTVTEFSAIGKVEYSFDGDPIEGPYTKLEEDILSIWQSDRDADEYIDFRLTVDNVVKTERVKISHDNIPNIDWELGLTCDNRILYSSDGKLKGEIPPIQCELFKTVDNEREGVETIPTGFDIQLYLDGEYNRDYNLNSSVDLNEFDSECRFVLVNQDENDNDVIWDEKRIIKEYAEAGEKGDDSVITQLSNPSSIVQLIDGKLHSNKTESYLQVRKSDICWKITSVEISDVRINGISQENPTSLISLNFEQSDSVNFTENKLTFTLNTGISAEEQVIEVDIKIVSKQKTFYETKTIIIQKSGGENAIHLELTNDMYNMTFRENHTCVSRALLYDGSTSVPEQNIKFDITRSNVAKDTMSIEDGGRIYLSNPDNSTHESVSVSVYAEYKGDTYEKTLTLTKNEDNIYLSIDCDIINVDEEIHNITGTIYQDNIPYTSTDCTVYYKVNGGSEQPITVTNGTFTIGSTTVSKVNSSLEIGIKRNNIILDKEVIGVVRNGQNAHYYQLKANHRYIVRSSDGSKVIRPIENIVPTFWEINGSNWNEINFDQLTTAGYYLCKSIDGIFSSTKLTENTLSTDPESVNTRLVYYLFKNSVDPSADTGWDDFVDIDADKLERGSNGPVIYPAGEWKSGTTYTGNSQKAPYVYVTNTNNVSYYIAYGTCTSDPSNSANVETSEILDWTNPSNKWIEMENFNAIYSDIGIFKEALVGKWVFYMDYMFSQDGIVGADGEDHGWTPGASMNYSDVLTSYPKGIDAAWESEHWIPNILFNAKTGEGHFGAGKVKLGTDSTVTSVGGWEVTDDGLVAKDRDNIIAKLSVNSIQLGIRNDNSALFNYDGSKILITNCYLQHSINNSNIIYGALWQYNGILIHGIAENSSSEIHHFTIDYNNISGMHVGDRFEILNGSDVDITIDAVDIDFNYKGYKVSDYKGDNVLKIKAGSKCECLAYDINEERQVMLMALTN